MGRPRKILDAQYITDKIAQAYTVEWVADSLCVHPDTLYSNYSEALNSGYARRNGCLQHEQYVTATEKKNAIMQIFLGKQPNWLGQTDKQDINVHKQTIVQMIVGIEQPKLKRLTEGYHRIAAESTRSASSDLEEKQEITNDKICHGT